MRRPDRYQGDRELDEYEEDEQYEDNDQYEEEEEEAAYEHENNEEENPQLTKDQLEYLERRQKLKEIVRQKMKKGNDLVSASAKEEKSSSRDRICQKCRACGSAIQTDTYVGHYTLGFLQLGGCKLTYLTSFGSFFGPSQPVIAKRVIEESRGLLDLRHISTSGSKAASQQNRSVHSVANAHVRSTESKPRPKPVVDKTKLKIQKLKEARDYSFLLSGDAEFPAPSKDRTPQQKPLPTSDAWPSQVTANRKPSVSKPANMLCAVRGKQETVLAGRPPLHLGAEKGAPVSKLKSFGGTRKLPAGNAGNGEPRKLPAGIAGNGEPRKLPAGNARNCEPRKPPACNAGNGETRKLPAGYAGNGDTRKLPAGNVGKGEPRKLPAGNARKGEPVKLPASNAGSGPGRPIGTKVPGQKLHGATLDHRKAASSTNKHKPSVSAPKTPLPKQQMVVQKQYIEKKRLPQKAEHATPKMTSLRPLSTSASAKVASQHPKVIGQQNGKPQKQLCSRPISTKRPKNRPADEYSDDEGSGGDFRSMIRQMFRYDPSRYRGMDEDDSDMEVDFRRIQAEERRSAKIAKEEDERELALIEEEERREREGKRRKLTSSRR